MRDEMMSSEMTTKEIRNIHLKDAATLTPERGLLRQILAFNPNMMLVRHQMEKGWVGTRHSHPNDQLVYVIQGHLQFTGGDIMFDARRGDSFIVPGGVEHQARAMEDSEVLDVFQPFREDYAPIK
jgi:quercetin dioxygenase-like cupin family protein